MSKLFERNVYIAIFDSHFKGLIPVIEKFLCSRVDYVIIMHINYFISKGIDYCGEELWEKINRDFFKKITMIKEQEEIIRKR